MTRHHSRKNPNHFIQKDGHCWFLTQIDSGLSEVRELSAREVRSWYTANMRLSS